jgi:DNA-binding CsgD family transcriptional regulator
MSSNGSSRARRDVQDMLNLLAPLGGHPGAGDLPAGRNGAAHARAAEDLDRKRRLLADVVRLIGRRMYGTDGGTDAEAGRLARNGNGDANGDGDGNGHPRPGGRLEDRSAAGQGGDGPSLDPITAAVANEVADLSPRMIQTLRSLLEGDSEKQAAAKLGVSPHTVHVYVKALYKRYKVSSRAELLARWVRRLSLVTG